jgi:hypothetical protein
MYGFLPASFPATKRRAAVAAPLAVYGPTQRWIAVSWAASTTW